MIDYDNVIFNTNKNNYFINITELNKDRNKGFYTKIIKSIIRKGENLYDFK